MAAGLAQVCLGVVEELQLCGSTVTVMTTEGAEVLAAASHATVKTLAELQFSLGEGPTREAFTTKRPLLVPTLAADGGRWIGFTPHALEMGVTGIYAFPLGLGALRLGVLTCYAEGERSLSRADLTRSLVHADTATALLLSTSARGGAHTPDPHVQESLHIRSEVYQAQGMLTIELGVGLADALARLRAMAFADGVDVNDLARDLVDGRRPFPDRDEET